MKTLLSSALALPLLVACEGALFASQPSTSLSAAVRAAQDRQGGVAVSADLEDDDENAVRTYEVNVIAGDQAFEVWVDAETGAVTDTWTDELEPEDTLALAEAKITLLDAIAAAEAHEGGYAVSADLDDGAARYEVEVVDRRRLFDVIVDASTGDVLRSATEWDD